MAALLVLGSAWIGGCTEQAEPVPPELYRSTTAARTVEFESVAGELRAALLERDLLARISRTAAVLQKLGPESAEKVLEVYETVWMDVGQTELVLLADWWGRFDPEAAMEWAESDMRTSPSRIALAVIRSWARHDPTAAVARAIKGRAKDGELRQLYVAAAIEGWEDSPIPGVLDFIRGMGPGADRQRAIRGYTRRTVLREGVDRAFQWADALDDEDKLFKLNVIRRITTDAVKFDPALTAKWVKKYDGTFYMRSLPQRVAMLWAKQSPLETLAWLKGLEAGQNRNEGVREGFRAWARRDLDAAVAWLTEKEHEAWLDEALALYARRVQLDDPEKATEWAAKIFDETIRTTTEIIIARTWAVQDPEAAEAWVAGNDNLTDKQKEKALYRSEMARRATLLSLEKRADLDERSAEKRLEDMSDPDASPEPEAGANQGANDAG